METGKILTADVLDIIFEKRNKAYGAYDLRKNYRSRLTRALAGTAVLAVAVCASSMLLGSSKKVTDEQVVSGVIELHKLADEPKPAQVPPPPKEVQPLVKTVKDVTLRIVPDKDVTREDIVPTQDDIVDAKIGTVNQDGPLDDNTITPPVDNRTGITGPTRETAPEDKVFIDVQIDAKYPGGLQAWSAYLYRKLEYPQEAQDKGIQGTIIVQFVVDREGNVSDVQAISGPTELYNAAVTAIRKSGKWEPAVNNGVKVKAYRKQPITFKLDQ